MRLSRIIIGGVIAAVAAAAVFLPVQAADYGGGNVQSYAADRPIDNGTIVELTGKNSDTVKPVSKDNLPNMFGVAIDPRHLSVKLNSGDQKNQTYVAVSGTYNVLVSTQGGAIAAGDHVTLSSINGVAMKAGTKEPTVFGRAVGSFDGKGVILGSANIKDTTSGKDQAVKLGSVAVTIDIKRNPNQKSTKTDVPEFLERIGQAIAEKEVSPIRIYLSMAITAVSLIAAIVVMYSGVRNSLISIGRNPMSKKSIFRALLEIILTSVLILIIGLFAVYLLLKL